MISFLPGPVLAVLNLLLVSVNTVLFSLPILFMSLVRVIIKAPSVQRAAEKTNYFIYTRWTAVNRKIIALTNKIDWHYSGLDDIQCTDKSCIVICNHLSWTDIVILTVSIYNRLPLTKFFLKHSLVYIPVVGLVCLGLGMPFMRRYTKEQLIKNPALKNKDIETTKKACRSLIYAPSTLVNFCEGTRFTKQKAARVRSPYKHLMPPKAASLGIALGQIGRDIDYIYDVTLAYPKNEVKPFIAMLKGRLHEVHFMVRKIKVTDDIIGDYLEDKEFKHKFTLWIREVWQQKDELLSREIYHDEDKLPKVSGDTAQSTAPDKTEPEPQTIEKADKSEEEKASK